MTDKIKNIITSAESDEDKALMVVLYLEMEKNSVITLQGELLNDTTYQAFAADQAAFDILIVKMQALVA